MNNVINIPFERGEVRVWQDGSTFSWATPNGSQGNGEESFVDAAMAALEAEGVNPDTLGYTLEAKS